jgi:hypothetical protein
MPYLRLLLSCLRHWRARIHMVSTTTFWLSRRPHTFANPWEGCDAVALEDTDLFRCRKCGNHWISIKVSLERSHLLLHREQPVHLPLTHTFLHLPRSRQPQSSINMRTTIQVSIAIALLGNLAQAQDGPAGLWKNLVRELGTQGIAAVCRDVLPTVTPTVTCKPFRH